MPKWVQIDEFRIHVLVAAGRTPRGVTPALTDPRLLVRLRAAVRQVMTEPSVLRRTRVVLSR